MRCCKWIIGNTIIGKMKELKQVYLKANKQTQNRLQEIIDTFKFDFDTLYNLADNKTKNRVNAYIEEWKDKGFLTGYFGILSKNIYNRTRVKNSEILELLIYSAYIEEQAKIKEQELNIMYDDVNYYYEQGQMQAKTKSKPKISILSMAMFLYLLNQPLYNGYTFEQNIETTIMYNYQQIYKQCLINIQQGIENDISNDIFQNIIKKQQNAKLCINNNKLSGNIDLTMIGLNNKVIVEGIKRFDKNAKVQFISDRCDNVTPMCMNMDRMIFNVNDYNDFTRYIGTSAKDIKQEKLHIFGLVQGINMPPINNFFHWCHSTIMYLKSESKSKDVMLNAKCNIFSNKTEKQIEKEYSVDKVRMKGIDKKVLSNILNNMDKVYDDFPQLRGQIKEIQSIKHPYGGLNITPDLEDNKYIMQINRNKFNDERISTKEYSKDLKAGFHPKGTTYKDMGIHELGHSIVYRIIKNKYGNPKAIANDWNKNITAKEIVEKAFKNLGISDKLTKDILRKQISNYATSDYGETIGEAFADYYANGNTSKSLSKEIIKVMKGMI